MLKIEDLSCGYRGLKVVTDLSLEIEAGEIYALIGSNGAGKTTILRAISGLIRPTAGSIRFDGQEIAGMPSHAIVPLGLIQVPEGRELFNSLTVFENLTLGGFTRSADEVTAELERVYSLFPILKERSHQVAGTMSGGQQQMLAIGRALMSKPRLLMLDEPSLGLAPNLVETVFETVREIARLGITILMVEQNAVSTLQMADRATVIENGQGVLTGPARDLLGNDEVRRAYLGQ